MSVQLLDKTRKINKLLHNNHSQRVDFNDGMGLEYWCQGEIVDFSKHWHKSTDTKVFHTDLIDSLGNYLKLYYLVGQTDYNNF